MRIRNQPSVNFGFYRSEWILPNNDVCKSLIDSKLSFKIFICGFIACFLLTGPPLNAQQRAGGGQRPSWDTMLERYDANEDGEIAQNEFRGTARMFSGMDKNGDGLVAANEFGGPKLSSSPAVTSTEKISSLDYNPESLVKVFDEDKNGAIDQEELLGFMKVMDRDNDQSISLQELKIGSGFAGDSTFQDGVSMTERLKKYDNFPLMKPAPGDFATMFTLADLDGNKVSLAELLKTAPVLIETGSYTCPVFRGRHKSIEKLAQEFQGKVHMVVLYGKEAHPGSQNYNDIHQPAHNDERIKLASMSLDELKISVPVLVDDVNNRVVDAYGGLANCGYIIGQDGRVFHKLSWIHPTLMKDPLEALLELGGSGGPKPPTFPVGGNHPKDSGKGREIERPKSAVSYQNAPVSIKSGQEDRISWTGADLPAAKKVARESGVPILVEFHFDGCPICAAMDRGPFVESDVVLLSRKFVPIKIDLTTPEGEKLGEEYGVIGTPTFILINSEGESVASHEGYIDSAGMVAFLTEGLARSR